MVFNLDNMTGNCPVCGEQANIDPREQGEFVDCSQCGDFDKRYTLHDEFGSPITDDRLRALASHLIRQLQVGQSRPILTREFFESLKHHTLPTPIEAMDNLVVFLGKATHGMPGEAVAFNFEDGKIISTIGVCSGRDVRWVIDSLKEISFVAGAFGMASVEINLTVKGWERFEQIMSAQIASKYAFFARQFKNPELDQVYKECLYDAVEKTGYELRIVAQTAGPVDAIIEDGIRRCRFLIADLSDDNNGAYWEAGFAEGLGKPVIYLCRAKDPKTGEPKKRHFDTEHRHTVWWGDDIPYEDTATKLKAVIRNTLLGDANQSDD